LDRADDDRYAAWLGAGFGAEPPVAAQSRVLSRSANLFQAGLLASRSRHPEGLAKILGQYFAMPVRVERYVAHWLDFEAADQTRLGYARNRGERATVEARALGVSATAGHKVRDRQSMFRVRFGPLTFAQYEQLLPPGRAWRSTLEWIRQYVGWGLRFDIQLVLAAEQVPPPRLGNKLRLGLTTWIGHHRDAHDRADLRLRPDSSFLLRSGAVHA
ncbi:MAG: type VI secretion system baseplate subunit TssG, partial [Pseudomonadota bacterium]|nr:type VI secretion system baseplate subunit TssG [Pseudomonadota bacterium]